MPKKKRKVRRSVHKKRRPAAKRKRKAVRAHRPKRSVKRSAVAVAKTVLIMDAESRLKAALYDREKATTKKQHVAAVAKIEKARRDLKRLGK